MDSVGHLDPVRVDDCKLGKNLPPVGNAHRPPPLHIASCQVQHFEQRFVVREQTLALGDFPQLPMVALDHIRRIDQAS